MARSRAWRRVVLSIAAPVALMPVLLQPLPAAASTTGTLFGIALAPTFSLATIDPASGTTTTVAGLTVAGQPAPGFSSSMVDDPATHRLFLVRILSDFSTFPPTTTDQLVTVDTRTGALTAITLLQPLAEIAFDTSSGTLFGLTAGNCCPNTLPITIVKVDPSTGVETTVATVVGDAFSFMAVDPASHLIYLDSDSFASFPATHQLLTVNPASGVVSPKPLLSGLRSLVFDPSLGSLFGITCCPYQFLQVVPDTGAETALGNYNFGQFLEPGTAIDSASHTIFVVQDVPDPVTGAPIAHIASIDDRNGSGALGYSTGTNVAALAFEPVLITSTSIQADVQKAAADGSIKTKALADSLLDKLAKAAEARTDGNCKAAARIYEAFIDQVTRQSGKKIATATATHLISEAQFLIANCP